FAVCAGQLCSALKDASFKFVLGKPQLLLGSLAFCDFDVQRVNGGGQSVSRSEQIREDCDLGSKDFRIDRLAQEIDATDVIRLKHVAFVEAMGGQEQDRNV